MSPLVILFAHSIKNLSRLKYNLTILSFFQKIEQLFHLTFNLQLTDSYLYKNSYKINLKKKPYNTHSKKKSNINV